MSARKREFIVFGLPLGLVRPQRVVDETDPVGDKLSVSCNHFWLHFDDGDEPHLKVVQEHSV